MSRLAFLLFFFYLSPECSNGIGPVNQSDQPLRVALAGFTGNAGTVAETVIGDALARDARVSMIDSALIRPALKGLRYDGSTNLSRDEARQLGAAVGCDFFIIGKAELVARSEGENRSFMEALIGVFIVDARDGSLVRFDFVGIKASSNESGAAEAATTLTSRTQKYVDDVVQWTFSRRPAGSSTTGAEIAEEIPDEGSPRLEGFTPPEFTNRVRPVYADEGDRADVSATVEARAVLRANGEVGAIEITRWAGYGLDDSAATAIRQLKFTPATRNGKPVSVWAVIRYNFRRSRGTEPLKTETQNPAAPERDLRQLFKPRFRPPMP